MSNPNDFPPPPPPPPPTGSNPSETVIGTIFLRKPKFMGRYDSFTAAITNQRLIVAQMTSQMLTDAAMKAREQAKAEGKGFMGQWSDQLNATFSYTQRYMTMSPDAILNETLGNFAINHNDMREVKLGLKRTKQASKDEFEVTFNCNQGSYVFRMDQRDAFTDLLKQVYGERVKMPFGYFSSHGVKVKFLR